MPRRSSAASGQVPVPPVLAVLRFPRTPPTSRGRDVVTTPEGAVVMAVDVTDRGRQVDVSGPDGAPLGRMVAAGRRRWVLVAPHTGAVVAEIDTHSRVQVSVGGGPWARVEGRTEEWDLVWEQRSLLSARRVPRREARRCVDVWVSEAACTPPVVASVLHVYRMWVAEQVSNDLALQQLTAASTPPPASY